MAEGGVDFGDDETTPLVGHTDNRDDDDVATCGNQTTGFEPGASSTPASNGNQRQTTMNRPGEQPSFVELPDPPGLSTTTFAEIELLKEFPSFNKNKIKYQMDDKGRLEVRLIDPKNNYHRLITKIAGKDEYRINPKIPKEILTLLGKSR